MRQPTPKPKPLPTPQPTALAHNPTEEEFAYWCESPITQWVAKAFGIMAETQTVAWTALMRERTPDASLLLLQKVEYQVRADAYSAFLETQYMDYLKTNDPKEWEEKYGKA